jgi:TM2 domain-containing membrane protein YozV
MEYVRKATSNLTLNEQEYFFKHYKKAKKSELTALILWLIGGPLGFHRFYLRHYGTGLILLAITIFTLGLGSIAGWYDVVNINRLTEKENKELILHLVKEAKRK